MSDAAADNLLRRQRLPRKSFFPIARALTRPFRPAFRDAQGALWGTSLAHTVNSPVLVVAAHDKLIDGHNGIFKPEFTAFLADYLAFLETKRFLWRAQWRQQGSRSCTPVNMDPDAGGTSP